MYKTTIFYDGKCGICLKAKSIVEKLDKKNSMQLIDLWTVNIQPRNEIKLEEMKKEIHLITSQGKVLRGYYAVKFILEVLLIPKVLFKLPFINLFGNLSYKIIANNRMRFLKCQQCTPLNCELSK